MLLIERLKYVGVRWMRFFEISLWVNQPIVDTDCCWRGLGCEEMRFYKLIAFLALCLYLSLSLEINLLPWKLIGRIPPQALQKALYLNLSDKSTTCFRLLALCLNVFWFQFFSFCRWFYFRTTFFSGCSSSGGGWTLSQYVVQFGTTARSNSSGSSIGWWNKQQTSTAAAAAASTFINR